MSELQRGPSLSSIWISRPAAFVARRAGTNGPCHPVAGFDHTFTVASEARSMLPCARFKTQDAQPETKARQKVSKLTGSTPATHNLQAFTDVQALVFDVFGTVVDWRTGVAREAASFLARHQSDADPAAFADAWRRRYSPAMEEVRSGRRPFARLDVLHRENLAATLPEFGIDPSAVPPS